LYNKVIKIKKMKHLKVILIFSLLFNTVAISFAQVVNKKSDSIVLKKASIGFKAGMFDFRNSAQTEGLTNSTPYFGLQFFKGIKNNLDFVVNLDVTSMKYPFYNSLKIPKSSVSQLYTGLDFSVNYKLGTDEKKVLPYITGGIGVGSIHESYYTAFVPVGLGLQFKMAHGSFLHLTSTYRAEASPLSKRHVSYGLSYSLPIRGRDKQAIELPPAPLKLDADNDGVIDSLDECPTLDGLKKYKGCPVPDADNDGINDENDQCPNQEGTIKYKGCPVPDADHDGIPDDKDKCPNNPGLNRYEGCPIPDSDQDGIDDEHDKCPNFAGIAANNGCIDLQPIADKAASTLKFATGKIALTKKQLAPVNGLIDLLKQDSSISIVINGHTDNTGSRKINDKLSLDRAAVVRKYMISQGIDPKRITLKGFADTKPIGDNKTEKGRAENRRTDFTVLYKTI